MFVTRTKFLDQHKEIYPSAQSGNKDLGIGIDSMEITLKMTQVKKDQIVD